MAVEDEAGAPTRIDATFRNGSITAISVLLGFSLSFLSRWASLPGTWHRGDLIAVVAIAAGIVLEVVTVALLLSVRSLRLPRYRMAIGIFLVGLACVGLGIAVAIIGDIAGAGQRVLGP